MKTFESSTYRLPALILHPLRQKVGVAVERFTLQVCQLVSIPVKQPSLAGSTDNSVGEPFAHPDILNIVKIGPSLLCFLLLLGFSALPIFAIPLVECEELPLIDQIQVQGSACRHNGTDLEPAPDGLKRPSARVRFLPALRQLMTGNKEFCSNLIAETFGLVVVRHHLDEIEQSVLAKP